MFQQQFPAKCAKV